MTIKKLLLLIFIVATLTSFNANNTRHITGRVFDYYANAPLSGKPVKIKTPLKGIFVKIAGSTDSVQTNSKGEYAIDVPEAKKTLIFSSPFYLTQKVNIGKTNRINVYLHIDPNILKEIIITHNNPGR